MEKIRCLIVDDEKLARTLLQNYVEKIPQLEFVKACKSAVEALDILGKEQIDLMLLDIQMPELTGIEFLQMLKQRPLVIFTTAYSEYALEGYQLDVIDYMLKPISFGRFAQGIHKAIERYELQQKAQNLTIPTHQTAEVEVSGNEQNDYITLKADHRIHKVFYNEILYIEGMREYVAFHMEKRSRIVTLESLKRLENTLPKQFMRVHKSFIINTNKAKSLYGNQIEIGETKIPIGKNYRETVLERIF